jgi:hypothetical protein
MCPIAPLPATSAATAFGRCTGFLGARLGGLIGVVLAALVIVLTASATAAVGLLPLRLIARLRRSAGRLGVSRHDDAIVVLGVLEIALGRDYIPRSQRIARQRHVFLSDMRCGAPDLHIRPV